MPSEFLPAPPARRCILVVDDDPHIRAHLEIFLDGEGFDVSSAEHGAGMRQTLEARAVDLVIIDLMLPGEDGFSLVRYLRDRYRVGIIMLTARTGSVDRIVGLEIGADDYVLKPYDPRELLARIRSVLRRIGEAVVPVAMTPAPAPAGDSGLRFGPWLFDREARTLTGGDGIAVDLSTGEFELLSVLVDNAGRVLSREFLLEAVRGRNWDYFDRSIDILVTRLRRKIEADPKAPAFIKTVRGAGYIFTAKGGGVAA